MPINPYGGYTNPYLNQNRYYTPQYTPQVQQPYMPQPVMQQPVAQPQPIQQPIQQQSFDMPIQDIRYLTADEIKAFIVMPNTKVMLIDKDNKLAHIKSADAMGQSSSKVYSFSEYVAEAPKPAEVVQPQIDTSMFVSSKDFSEVTDKIMSKLEKLEKQVNIKSILKDKGE